MGCNASKETKKKEDCGGGGIIMADDKEKEKEQGDSLMYKFVLIGDKDVGKTTLIVRYTELVYRQPPASLNVDFKTKSLTINHKHVNLQIWDTAGEEMFRTISSAYYRNAQAIILSFAVDNLASYENITRQWMVEVKRYARNVIICLVGLKGDLTDERSVTPEMCDKLAGKLGVPYFEISSKTSLSEVVSRPFLYIASELMNSEEDYAL
eukprot:TRINITY_DN4837_c0_g1_i1.p1 TRINITY_DN4837_c0_g1~~TRINITY_DN4837_c0_g1_i1.p1  ORF type:complete len:209 (-),score=22.22 TRINITY_DN4837_c0_g1_i1:131-757(-)